MRDVLRGLLCLWVVGLHLLAAGQNPPPQAAPKPAQGQAALAPGECLDFLTSLNNDGKLVPEAVFPNAKLNDLKAEDGFCLRLANGQRMAGWSPVQGFGYSGTVEEQGPDGKFGPPQPFKIIGFLASEFPLEINGNKLAAGSYAVEIFTDSLRLVGNDPEHSGPVDFRTGRATPLPKTVKLTLKEPLPATVVGEHATEVARYSVSVRGDDVVLSFRGKEWKIVAQKIVAR